MTIRVVLVLICFYIVQITANTEKTIFSAPELTSLSQSGPSLAALQVEALSPARSQIRTAVPVVFGDTVNSHGNQSWYILSNLTPGRRYEVRVCWPATVSTKSIQTYQLAPEN